RGHDVFKPVVEPVRQLPGPVRDGNALPVVLLGLTHLLGGFFAGTAVDSDAFAGARSGPGVEAAHPAAIGTAGYRSFSGWPASGAGHQAASSGSPASRRTQAGSASRVMNRLPPSLTERRRPERIRSYRVPRPMPRAWAASFGRYSSFSMNVSFPIRRSVIPRGQYDDARELVQRRIARG